MDLIRVCRTLTDGVSRQASKVAGSVTVKAVRSGGVYAVISHLLHQKWVL